ncbi:MAG: response regulator [Chloroflexota bacterium]
MVTLHATVASSSGPRRQTDQFVNRVATEERLPVIAAHHLTTTDGRQVPTYSVQPEHHQHQHQEHQQLGTVVLVVDDDPEIRDLVRWLLEDEGWTVETAADGRAALDQATRTRPALIVLDMGLPLLNGEEVARRLHDVYADPPPIVVVSADGRAGERAARIGAASFLHKPFNVEELAELVRSTLMDA